MRTSSRQFVVLCAFALFQFALPMRAAQTTYTYPQITRLSYVEGDVRLSTDAHSPSAPIGTSWTQAQAGIPIQQGYSLATDTGRAEIELEDGSVVYLADNSSLLFNQLTITDGIPSTHIVLLTGTATINATPLPQETISLETPNENAVVITYPARAFVRVDSFLDGMSVTPQGDTAQVDTGNQKLHLTVGETMTYFGPHLAHIAEASKTATTDEWDQWVTSRVSARQSALAAALKASGLSQPVPGIVDLYQNGKFFPCAPYGTCWQPNQQATSAQQPPPQAPTAQSPSVAAPNTPLRTALTYRYFPCETIAQYSELDPRTNKWVAHEFPVAGYWDLDSCAGGSWIYRNQGYVGYVLVVPKKRRHHKPVCWVHVAGHTGFVPAHPRDKTGQLPVNLKHGLFLAPSNPAQPIKWIAVNSSEKAKILEQPPSQYREISSYLPKAPQPEIQAHLLANDPLFAAKAGANDEKKIVTYDYGKKEFVSSDSDSRGTAKPVVVARLASLPAMSKGSWFWTFGGADRSGVSARTVQSSYNGRTSPNGTARASRGRSSGARSGGVSRGSAGGSGYSGVRGGSPGFSGGGERGGSVSGGGFSGGGGSSGGGGGRSK